MPEIPENPIARTLNVIKSTITLGNSLLILTSAGIFVAIAASIFVIVLSNKPDITIFAILVFIIGLILLLMSARFRLNKRIRTNEMNSLVDTRLSDKDNAIRAAAFQFLLASYTSLRRADLNQYLLFAVLALTALFMVFAGLIADIDRRVLGANDLSTQKEKLKIASKERNEVYWIFTKQFLYHRSGAKYWFLFIHNLFQLHLNTLNALKKR